MPLDAVPDLGVPHGFTSRAGGVSTGPLASLNLAQREHEDPAHLVENWRRVVHTLHPSLDPAGLALLSQVHGGEVVRVDAGGGPLAAVAEADAAFTTTPGVILAVRTADCVGVLVSGPGVTGVAHAGWRGAACDIVGALVEQICGALGLAPSDLQAAIGPAISGSAYEVGDEVVAGLRSSGLPERSFRRGDEGRAHVDLPSAVAAQLRRRGVPRVAIVRRCTFTDPGLYSHRRDGASAGRQAAVITGPCP